MLYKVICSTDCVALMLRTSSTGLGKKENPSIVFSSVLNKASLSMIIVCIEVDACAKA